MSNEITETQVDEMLSEIESPADPIPMTSPQPDQTQAQETQPQETAEPEYEINWGGNNVKLPLSKLRMYAQQGYDYQNKMSQNKSERQALEAQRSEIEQKLAALDEYGKVQEWAKTNPTLWEAARQGYQSFQGQSQNSALDIESHPAFKAIREELEGLKRQSQSVKQAESDAALDQQVSAFKAEHSYFDWSEQDENGDTLEQRIYNHAVEHGIGSFQAAAKDMLFEKIVEKRTALAKEKAAKDIQRVNRLGITPLKPKTAQSRTNRDLTYEELELEALKELGLGG